jgi:hypothetical protein
MRRLGVLVIAASLAIGVVQMTPAQATTVGARIGPWSVTAVTESSVSVAGQGVTTVQRGSGSYLLTRGNGSVPADLRSRGWIHIGDPSSWRGYVLDAYQGSSSAQSVLFSLTDAQGHRSDFTHRLVPGELYNNSFTALTPDGQWFAAGEWGTVSRLLVFATPGLNPRASRTGDLALAATMSLDRPVRDVQGCAFATSTTLICSTNDRGSDLYPTPRQLLSIRLGRALDGTAARGSVSYLGEAPAPPGPAYSPAGEVEGIDVRGTTVTVAVNAPYPHRDDTFTYTLGLTNASAG